MNRRQFIKAVGAAGAAICSQQTLAGKINSPSATKTGKLPNNVYIMSDELAYYELSHMGNEKIHTPVIDRMAAEGIRFTQALAGAPVCAPLRCSLMTGKHMGHASVRANDGGTPLRAEEQTIASIRRIRNVKKVSVPVTATYAALAG